MNKPAHDLPTPKRRSPRDALKYAIEVLTLLALAVDILERISGP